jgi:hypothetical protein
MYIAWNSASVAHVAVPIVSLSEYSRLYKIVSARTFAHLVVAIITCISRY